MDFISRTLRVPKGIRSQTFNSKACHFKNNEANWEKVYKLINTFLQYHFILWILKRKHLYY